MDVVDGDTVALRADMSTVVYSDVASLDTDMRSVLYSEHYKGDMKWFQYHKALERHIFRKHPTYTPHQFTFEVQEDTSGEVVYIIHPGKKKSKSKFEKILKYAPSFIGPILGACVAALLRS